MRLALGFLILTTLATAAESPILRRDTFDIGNHKSSCEVFRDGAELRFKMLHNIGGQFQVVRSSTVKVTDGLSKTIETVLTQKIQRSINFGGSIQRVTFSALDVSRGEWMPFHEHSPGEDRIIKSDESVALRTLIDSYCR